MNILVFYPYNLRSVEQLSVMEFFIRRGDRVILLTTCSRGQLHVMANEIGVIAEHVNTNSESNVHFYLKNIKALSLAIKKYDVDVVVAHQQKPALIAGLLRKFMSFRLFYIRHNSDEDYLNFPVKAKWLNKIVNHLTNIKIAPSDIVEKFWIEREKVKPEEIYRINYGYNFVQYEKPDLEEVQRIRKEFSAELLIISIARLVPAKRHREMLMVIREMRDKGLNCKMICLGGGPLTTALTGDIQAMNLEGAVHLLGRKENVFDYIEAADLFLHLSTTEASNSAVKEVGLCKKPVIVCKEVGDFQDYIRHGDNGFLVSRENPVPEICSILSEIVTNKIDKVKVGEQLFKTVTTFFHIDQVASAYETLLRDTGKKSGL